jgi:Anti-sigma factor NepR
LHPRDWGDERLSGSEGEGHGIGKSKSSGKAKSASKAAPREKGARKHRAADLGRALRSVYDDTLREAVPDDFLDLLGKLS